MALEFLPPVTTARLFVKDKYLEPMFGDVGQARTNAAMLLQMIATTSSRTCTKPTVGGSFGSAHCYCRASMSCRQLFFIITIPMNADKSPPIIAPQIEPPTQANFICSVLSEGVIGKCAL